MTLEEMLQAYLAAQLEASKTPEAPALENQPEYATKADVAVLLEGFATKVAEVVKEQVDAALPVREPGAGRKGEQPTPADTPEAKKASDPIGYLVAKAQKPGELTPEDKRAVVALFREAITRGMTY